jgi:hypothetical protein
MWRLILKFFNTRFVNFILAFFCLGSKSVQIIIFVLNTLRGCSVRIQIRSMRIQNTLGATSASNLCSYWLILGDVDLIG